MRINSLGKLVDEPRVRAGFIGCGSHSFRNLYPVLRYTAADLTAVCDLDVEKAKAFAKQFGATAAYGDYTAMLEKEKLEAVFICAGYDERGRPRYPKIAVDCLKAGCHVWMEKPPAATCAEIDLMAAAEKSGGRHAMVGFKKMFFPANEKAKSLMDQQEFGKAHLGILRYPQHLPSPADFAAFRAGEVNWTVTGFLDHLCHPVSLMIFLFGMPSGLTYRRSSSGGGAALFSFPSGTVVSMALTHGASNNGGMEQTVIVSDKGTHITVDNNIRLTRHRAPSLPYGASPSFFMGDAESTSSVWEPEFSLGQLYNKSLFIQGFFGEINEFCHSILEKRSPAKAGLEHAWQATRIFEAFFEGEGKEISLKDG